MRSVSMTSAPSAVVTRSNSNSRGMVRFSGHVQTSCSDSNPAARGLIGLVTNIRAMACGRIPLPRF